MQRIGEDSTPSSSAKDLSTQINYLNDLLDKGAIDEQEYAARTAKLQVVAEVIQCASLSTALGEIHSSLNNQLLPFLILIFSHESSSFDRS